MAKIRQFEAKKLHACTWCKRLRLAHNRMVCLACAKMMITSAKRRSDEERSYPLYDQVIGNNDLVCREDFDDISDPLETCDLGVV
jgi:hypothetical protein